MAAKRLASKGAVSPPLPSPMPAATYDLPWLGRFSWAVGGAALTFSDAAPGPEAANSCNTRGTREKCRSSPGHQVQRTNDLVKAIFSWWS